MVGLFVAGLIAGVLGFLFVCNPRNWTFALGTLMWYITWPKLLGRGYYVWMARWGFGGFLLLWSAVALGFSIGHFVG